MDKSMYKYVGILVGMIALIVILLLLKNLVSGGVKLSYEEIEEKLVTATMDYIEEFPGALPSTSDSTITISSATLINAGYIKDLSSYVGKENIICNGSVDIYLANDSYYNYVPSLYCGSAYETTKLYNKVLIDNEFGVVSGSGLYQRVDGEFILDEQDLSNPSSTESFEYVFRGEEVNNYVLIDDNYWRIVAITDSNDMILIYVGHTKKTLPWDDRFNSEVGKTQGINEYEQNGLKSRAMEAVESFYKGEISLFNNEKYSSKTNYLISPMNLCVGKRSTTETDISGAIECKKILENQYVGLLPAYYYMSASLDDECTTISSKNCGNHNYLSQFEDYWWLLTTNSETTNEAYNVAKKYVESALCSSKSNVRPMITLGSRAIYEKGNGTEADPYVVKFYE
ncbi:MAG: hypothetical protein J6A52_02635 [Bacilli bacterium]|nr:hypothetical protein [Bacilli bacterium]